MAGDSPGPATKPPSPITPAGGAAGVDNGVPTWSAGAGDEDGLGRRGTGEGAGARLSTMETSPIVVAPACATSPGLQSKLPPAPAGAASEKDCCVAKVSSTTARETSPRLGSGKASAASAAEPPGLPSDGDRPRSAIKSAESAAKGVDRCLGSPPGDEPTSAALAGDPEAAGLYAAAAGAENPPLPCPPGEGKGDETAAASALASSAPCRASTAGAPASATAGCRASNSL